MKLQAASQLCFLNDKITISAVLDERNRSTVIHASTGDY
jgi:Cu/Zn superoxide dismutase